jgi:hypothetical protein
MCRMFYSRDPEVTGVKKRLELSPVRIWLM